MEKNYKIDFYRRDNLKFRSCEDNNFKLEVNDNKKINPLD